MPPRLSHKSGVLNYEGSLCPLDFVLSGDEVSYIAGRRGSCGGLFKEQLNGSRRKRSDNLVERVNHSHIQGRHHTPAFKIIEG